MYSYKSSLGALLVLIFASIVLPANAQTEPEFSNMELVGHNDLNGNGDGGEGLALQQLIVESKNKKGRSSLIGLFYKTIYLLF